jgi:hypothetical protein
MGIPDLRFINRKVPIVDVARALDLKVGVNGNIHCWRSELHHNGDRTASVGIRKTTNTVKCFGSGCGIGPLGPVDLVMAVLNLSTGEAGRWIAERFDVPDLRPGTHLIQSERYIFQFGQESDIGLLVHSGLWARLSPPARSLVPVLLQLAERVPGKQSLAIQISYRALQRFSGLSSPNAVSAGLRELQGITWLHGRPGQTALGSRPIRETSIYFITPRSDEMLELAHANYRQIRSEIEAERDLRAKARAERRKTSAY